MINLVFHECVRKEWRFPEGRFQTGNDEVFTRRKLFGKRFAGANAECIRTVRLPSGRRPLMHVAVGKEPVIATGRPYTKDARRDQPHQRLPNLLVLVGVISRHGHLLR